MNCFGIFGPSVPIQEKHLQYTAGLGGKSPLDSAVKYKVQQSHVSPVWNTVSSTFSGMASTAGYLTSGVSIFSFYSGFNAILSNTSDVCDGYGVTASNMPGYFLTARTSIINVASRALDFAKSVGLSDESRIDQMNRQADVALDGFFSNVGQKLFGFTSSFNSWLLAEGCKMQAAIENSFLFQERFMNYFDQLVTNFANVKNHPYTPVILGAAAIALSAKIYADNEKNAVQAEQEVIAELKIRVAEMQEKLQELSQDPERRGEAIALAKGILTNLARLEKEIDGFDLHELPTHPNFLGMQVKGSNLFNRLRAQARAVLS